nr:ATP-binding cassette domain-containing protein [uncultured Carboxylicivirga sp.]
MTKFEISQVEKRFGTRSILTDIKLECIKGEILGIFGRNGCGKSTLLKIIFGALKYDKFQAKLNNEIYNPNLNIKKQQIAYLPQHNILPLKMKVRDIVSIFHTNPELQDKILYNPKIASNHNSMYGNLSQGEKRYFEIILFSLLPHSVIIFDEPFSNIDPIEQKLISGLLLELKKDKVVIITDHYFKKVLNITDQNILINNGVSQQINAVDELINSEYLRKN